MKTIILDKVPIFISVFGVLILLLSITYDYGFFLNLELKFSEMPTTLSDHLRSSLDWTPTAIIGLFILYGIEMFIRRMEQGQSENELIQTSKYPKFIAWFHRSPQYIIIASALFPIVAYFYEINLPLSSWQLTAIVFWFIFHNFVYSHNRILENTPHEMYLVTRWLPFIIIVQLFQGAIAADVIKKGIGKEYVLKTKETNFSGILAKAYEKYFLLWDTEKQEIQLVSSSEIISIIPKNTSHE